jgi:hypothetical protein
MLLCLRLLRKRQISPLKGRQKHTCEPEDRLTLISILPVQDVYTNAFSAKILSKFSHSLESRYIGQPSASSRNLKRSNARLSGPLLRYAALGHVPAGRVWRSNIFLSVFLVEG